MGNKKLFIIAGAIAAAFVGVIYFDNTRQVQAPTEENDNESADETSDWKTYRNEEYGFELRYPSNLNPLDNGGLILFRDSTAGAFVVSINTGNFAACTHFEGEVQTETVTISGTEVLKSECGTMVEYIFFPPHSNFFIYSSSRFLDRKIFNKVLSTFKFIEP